MSHVDTCLACGHERRANVNQCHVEIGAWHASVAQETAREDARILASVRAELARRGDAIAIIVRSADAWGVTIWHVDREHVRAQHLTHAELRIAAEQPDAELAARYRALQDAARPADPAITPRAAEGFANEHPTAWRNDAQSAWTKVRVRS